MKNKTLLVAEGIRFETMFSNIARAKTKIMALEEFIKQQGLTEQAEKFVNEFIKKNVNRG